MEDRTRLHPALTVRLYTDKKCFGPGVAMLLRRVESLHSLRAAAMDMDMAYSKAWTILRTAEEELGVKLVHSTTGGRGGGGAVLTKEGAALLEAFDGYERELKETAERLFPQYFPEWLPPGAEKA
ncbi:MAG: LysR family transcriptional regulator [Oscillospiraceae bacterium]|nr:LysR family transcriptional regulator [Oscillospiraceae bacterium]